MNLTKDMEQLGVGSVKEYRNDRQPGVFYQLGDILWPWFVFNHSLSADRCPPSLLLVG